MSDDTLSVIPADPYWQPDQAQAERAVSAVAAHLPGGRDGLELEIEVQLYKKAHLVDCGSNLSRISCPHCGKQIDTTWWRDVLEERFEDGLDDLSVMLPCCGRPGLLNELDYDWPCGFARFEIEICNPNRDWFTEEELSDIAEALGHPVRQIMARV